MAFFISYPLSAIGHDISPRAGSTYDKWTRADKGYDMKNDMLWSYIKRGKNWFVPKWVVIFGYN
jgi:hypothetical protein